MDQVLVCRWSPWVELLLWLSKLWWEKDHIHFWRILRFGFLLFEVAFCFCFCFGNHFCHLFVGDWLLIVGGFTALGLSEPPTCLLRVIIASWSPFDLPLRPWFCGYFVWLPQTVQGLHHHDQPCRQNWQRWIEVRVRRLELPLVLRTIGYSWLNLAWTFSKLFDRV